MRPRRLVLALVVLGVLVVGLAGLDRRMWVVRAVAWLDAPSPELLPAADEGPDATWWDDYFTVEALDEATFAIGEPRYTQQNFNYLIVGRERAVLFDAGPGVREIRPVVESLTDLPVTFVPSHFHYDHLGVAGAFDRVGLVDLPMLRARTSAGALPLLAAEHLGFLEGQVLPTLTVSEWLAPDSEIELGGRTLRVIATPGHTPESISLLDAERGWLFTGDFLYPGPLFAMLPNSHMGQYLEAAERLGELADPAWRLLGAHRDAAPGAPVLRMDDVTDLRAALVAIRDGEAEGTGTYPVSYRINERIELVAEPRWLQRWP